MNWALFVLILICSIGDDILCVFYYRRVNGDTYLSASLLSGALTAMVSFSVICYTQEWIYMIPNVVGSMVGTPFAMWLDGKLPKTKARDAKGRFKVPIKPTAATPPSEKGL